MKRKFFSAICAIALAYCLTAPVQAAPDLPATVLTGLYYGNTAMDGANLQNKVGSGFQFGWLDDRRTFHEVGYTDQTAISVVKTQNVYYGTSGGYTSYFDQITSDILVGCWHVEPAVSFRSFAEAKTYADRMDGFPVWTGETYLVRIGAFKNSTEAQAAASKFQSAYGSSTGVKVTGTSGYGVSVVKTGTNQVLFQFDAGAEKSLAVQARKSGDSKPVTIFRNASYYGGFQYQRARSGDLTISNFLPMEDYISCVISREMSPTWPLEALKAQAVAARTYFQTNLSRHASSHFDICSTTHCQAYYGMDRVNEVTDRAAAETAGLRVWYQGELAETFYYASNGGGSEDAKNVWGTSLPYLVGVVDPYEETIADKIDFWNWQETFTGAELTRKLQAKGYNCAQIVDFRVTERTPTDNVKSIVFVDANGKSWNFYRSDVSLILGLKSIRYTVAKTGESTFTVYYISGGGKLESMDGVHVIDGNEDIAQLSGNPYVITGDGVEFLPPPQETTVGGTPGSFQVNGSGWGHSVGMSQWGAYAMAQQGKTFRDILTFYFPGVEIY